ncbi:hypothetical protein J2W40_001167 [Sphingobium xenophagum]|uniref:Transposase n=1 Tax=Sphingobium xenophagum TaxID=121428 RepID=A0ABU1WYF8_SPHXE|nr:hypothetical protein [Sphingobium xenophagum]MDR7154355.1 hypothetical protein [Sphingobium xenophagum]
MRFLIDARMRQLRAWRCRIVADHLDNPQSSAYGPKIRGHGNFLRQLRTRGESRLDRLKGILILSNNRLVLGSQCLT